jgi:hypothetical protein
LPTDLKEKPQGETRLRGEVNQDGKIRDYISPVGGALNTRWVDNKIAFIFSCLLSEVDLMAKVYHFGMEESRKS